MDGLRVSPLPPILWIATMGGEVIHRQCDEQKQARKTLHTAQSELRQLALNGGDTTAKTAEVQQLLGQTIALRVKVLQEIGPILTPEQRVKFAQAHGRPGMGRHHKAPTSQS